MQIQRIMYATNPEPHASVVVQKSTRHIQAANGVASPNPAHTPATTLSSGSARSRNLCHDSLPKNSLMVVMSLILERSNGEKQVFAYKSSPRRQQSDTTGRSIVVVCGTGPTGSEVRELLARFSSDRGSLWAGTGNSQIDPFGRPPIPPRTDRNRRGATALPAPCYVYAMAMLEPVPS